MMPLGIALHRSGKRQPAAGLPATASKVLSEALIAKLSQSYGHLFLHGYIRAARLDGDVETLILVIALRQRRVKTAMFGLAGYQSALQG